jgi:hypothetical protein
VPLKRLLEVEYWVTCKRCCGTFCGRMSCFSPGVCEAGLIWDLLQFVVALFQLYSLPCFSSTACPVSALQLALFFSVFQSICPVSVCYNSTVSALQLALFVCVSALQFHLYSLPCFSMCFTSTVCPVPFCGSALQFALF